MADTKNNDDYDSYDDYVNKATKSVTKTVVSSDDKNSSDDYGSYDDYKANNESNVTPDEGDSYTGGSDEVTVTDNRGDGDKTAESDRGSTGDIANSEQSDNVLLQDGGEFGASSFSEGGIVQNAKGAIGGAASGLKNALMGGFGGLLSALKGSAGKAKAGVGNIASNLNLPVQIVAIVLSVITGGSVVSIFSIMANNRNDIAKYSDYSNCNKMEMIDEYKGVNGKGDHWTISSAQGAAKSIYTALSATDSITFKSRMWDAGAEQWVDTEVTNDGFGFSDEVIAGMISNAYGESKVRADCYEMDYFVHDLSEKNAAGEYFRKVGYNYAAGDSDYVLANNHHVNWNNYVNRMFELYGASGMSINEDGYKWDSKSGMPMFSDVAVSGLNGLYPGVGLWQWTGQRAYDLSRFANIQPNPVDTDQDGVHDTMYTLNCQLAFLYLENYGNFTSYGVSESGVLAWGREQTYSFYGNLGTNDGFAYKNLSYSVGDDSFSSTGSNLDTRDNVFKGQSETNVDDEKDTWNPDLDDNTIIRFPKFVVKLDGNIVVGDGSGDEARNQSNNTGKIADWTGYGQSLSTYMTYEDNQVKERFAVGSQYEAEQEITANIALATMYNGLDDKGYWSVTAVDELAGGDAKYRITAQSSNGAGEGNPSREGNDIRVGREFNDKELYLLQSLYEVKQYSESETFTNDNGTPLDPTDDYEDTQWYHVVALVLLKDSVESTGVDDEWQSLHNDMSSMEGENAKYIARDLRVAAGAESAAECALQFYNKWEGLEGNIELLRSHTKMAGSFYILMQTDGWESNNEYAHSILNMVDDNLTSAELSNMYASYVNMDCDELSVGFEGIAEAAVSWAWPKDTTWYDINDESTMDAGGNCYKLTKCTELYVAVKDVVEPEDVGKYYSSCCRAVSTAVRASGADDDMELGGAKEILNYCRTHPDKWENIGMINSKAFLATLQPGDLLLSEGHVMIFVGPDLPLEKWPGGAGELTDCTYAAVHASRSSSLADSRGPRCDNSCEWLVSDSKVWYAYRCVSYESSSQYKTLAESMNFAGLHDGSSAP